MKSSLGAVQTQNGTLLSLKADDDTRMSLQSTTITSFIGTEEGRHPQSKAEKGRFGYERTQGNFLPARIVKILKFSHLFIIL